MVVGAIKTGKGQRILILGSQGMLGHALQPFFPRATLKSHQDLDITNRERVLETIRSKKYSVIINSAAFTNVEAAEEMVDAAIAVNATGPEYIAEACEKSGSRLIHFSTDYVFDGSKQEFDEDDIPNPINSYGKSKYLGERAIRENMGDYRIIRTSGLFGNNGKNFIDTIQYRSKQQEYVK